MVTLRFIRGLCVFACVAAVCACSNNPVSNTPPPPTSEPPKITCPAAVTQTSPNGLAIPVTYGAATVALGAAPVTTTCTPANGSSFSPGTTTVTCTATDALNRTDSCTFPVTVTQPPRLLLTSFLAFGDSITLGEDGQNSSAFSFGDRIRPLVVVANPYPAVLQTFLASRYTSQSPVVSNAGCRGELAGGDSPCAAGGTRARFDSLILGGRYQAVLLMEGANDLSEQFSTGRSSFSDQAIAGLQSMIGDARRAGMRVFLATLPPENPLAGVPARRGQAAALVPTFNDRIKSLASTESAIVVDVYQAISADANWQSTQISLDGLHATQTGYQTIANAFLNALKQNLETTPSPTPTSLRAPLSVPARTGSSATTAATGPGSRPATRKPR